MKKIITTLMVATAMVFTLGAFTGCSGQNDEQVIREALSKELDACKNLDDNAMQELIGDMDLSELTTYGINGTDFMKSYLEGFDYSIDSVTVDGDKAEAIVTLTCKSFSGFETALTSAAESIVSDPTAYADMSMDELNQMLGTMVMDAINGVELAKTEPITISYTKSGNEWTPDSTASQNISSAMMTN